MCELHAMHGGNKKYAQEFDRKYYDIDFLELRYVKYGERIRNELSESENVSMERFSGSETQDCIAIAKVT
jgi:hypothetical protein